MELDPRIYVVIIVPDGLPEQATPLQGFAPSLCFNSWMIDAAMRIPSTIFDPTPEGQSTLLARRMGGTNPVNWIGQTPRAVRSSPLPPSLPFTIVMLGDGQSAAEYSEWATSSAVSPTVVAERGADLTYSQLNLTNLQQRFLAVCKNIPSSVDGKSIERAVNALHSWEHLKRRPYRRRSRPASWGMVSARSHDRDHQLVSRLRSPLAQNRPSAGAYANPDFWGKQDKFLLSQMAQDSLRYCDSAELTYFPDATHWVQHEEAERVNQSLLEFFRS